MNAMERKQLLAMTVFVVAALTCAACSNQNGAGGTVDGTDETNYELNQGHLVPPMDSVEAAAVPVAPLDTSAGDSTATGQ